MDDLGRELAADLRDLAVDLSGGGYTHTTLAMLDRNVRRSVPSVLGVTIALSNLDSDTPVEVNLVPRTVEPDEIAAVLRVPLAPLVADVRGDATFYASEARAFFRLAADLAAALDVEQVDLDQQQRLPARAIHPGISGLQDFSLVNRALGVLLNRGYDLVAARADLRRRARSSGTDLVGAARAVLASEHY